MIDSAGVPDASDVSEPGLAPSQTSSLGAPTENRGAQPLLATRYPRLHRRWHQQPKGENNELPRKSHCKYHGQIRSPQRGPRLSLPSRVDGDHLSVLRVSEMVALR